MSPDFWSPNREVPSFPTVSVSSNTNYTHLQHIGLHYNPTSWQYFHSALKYIDISPIPHLSKHTSTDTTPTHLYINA